MLLLLHDTFSTPQAAFADWTGDASFARVHAEFGGRCLAFTHPTLATGLDENLGWLVTHLAPLPGPIDIVAHGRGGLLARALAADGRLPLRRVCQVGTPNKGTLLALPANLMRFLDAHVDMLAGTSSIVGQTTLEGALCMLRFVALGLPRRCRVSKSCSPDGARRAAAGARSRRTAMVHRERAVRESRRPRRRSSATSSRPLPTTWWCPPTAATTRACAIPRLTADSAAPDVHHHNYFTNLHVRERLAIWLR